MAAHPEAGGARWPMLHDFAANIFNVSRSTLQKPLLGNLDRLPSVRSIGQTLAGSMGLLSGHGFDVMDASCPADTPLSCHNTTTITDTCCTNTPGGLALQTQFWDYSPATGPSDSWTVHGLWPDNCDGTYEQFCDPNRQYTNITQMLQAEGRNDLLDYMNTYWVSDDGTNEAFWEHEWGKHGTCFSTLDTDCYTDYQPQQEVGEFFNATVSLYKTVDTYAFLSAAGIVPSDTATYALSDVQDALTQGHGFLPTIKCDDNGAFDEVWYYYNIQGTITDGTFVATAATSAGNCGTTIKYPTKSSSSSPTTSVSSTVSPTSTAAATSAAPTSTAAPFTGNGYLSVVQSGQSDSDGCLISAGNWYVSGTCATYSSTATDDGFTLASSRGNCAIDPISSAFSCAAGNSNPTVFQTDGLTLQYSDSPAFYATAVAVGSSQQAIYAGTGAVPLSITWQAV